MSARGTAALFLDMIAAERGASANTLAAYGRDLADYEEFLASEGAGAVAAVTDNIRASLAATTRPPCWKAPSAGARCPRC